MILPAIIGIALIILAAWTLPPLIFRVFPLPDFLFGMVCTCIVLGIGYITMSVIHGMGITLPFLGQDREDAFAQALLSLSMPGVGVLMIRLAQLRRDRR